MLALNRITNRFQRQCYQYALAGFAVLGFGYLLRGQITQTSALVILMLGVFPNLLGSFATPFYLAFLLEQRFPDQKIQNTTGVFAFINLLVFTVCLLIEYLHVVFQAGAWDPNDIAASAAGGLTAMLVYSITRKMIKTA